MTRLLKEGQPLPLADLWHKWTTADANIICTTAPNGLTYQWQGRQLVAISGYCFKELGISANDELIQVGPYQLRRVVTHYYNDTVILALDAPNAFWYVWRVRLLKLLFRIIRMA